MENWEKVRFDEIIEDCTRFGKKIKTNYYNKKGTYAIIDQGQEYIAGFTDETNGVYSDVPAIIFGDHTRVFKYVDFPFFLGADGVKILKAKQKISYKYIFYYFLQANFPNTGYARHYKWLKELEIPLPPLETQKHIACVLDKASSIIEKNKTLLAKYDLLIKSVFVQMFGDPIENPKDWEVKKLGDVFEIIDGDRGKNYPKAEEFSEYGHCLFLNAGNVTKIGFSFEKCQFITEEKDKILRNGKLNRNDIVVTTRGTVGNIVEYTSDITYENVRINSGMVILRKKIEINSTYFMNYFKNPIIFGKLISGTAQLQMPITSMRKCNILLPPLSLQNDFASFVEKVEQSKQKASLSLQKAQTLYKSLMQQYFG